MNKVTIEVTQDERFYLELLRRCKHVGGFITDWSDEIEVVAQMSDEMLRRYNFHHLSEAEDLIESHFGGGRLCEDCEADMSIESDLGYSECFRAANDWRSVRCMLVDEVSYPLRALVLADMMLCGMWGA